MALALFHSNSWVPKFKGQLPVSVVVLRLFVWGEENEIEALYPEISTTHDLY